MMSQRIRPPSDACAGLRLATAMTSSPDSASNRPRVRPSQPEPAIAIGPWEERPPSLERAAMVESWRKLGAETRRAR